MISKDYIKRQVIEEIRDDANFREAMCELLAPTLKPILEKQQ